MADLSNVDAQLAERIRGMQNEAGQRGIVMVVTTGYRSYDEQLRLYNAMLQAQAKYGKKWQKYAALAAKPGTSMHERNPSLAVDLACAGPTKDNIKIHGELATKWGLWRAVASEYWHLQLIPGQRPPIPGQPTKEESMTLVIDPLGAVDRPQHDGGWAFGKHGHVYSYGKASYFGGWDDQTRNDPSRWCVALVRQT